MRLRSSSHNAHVTPSSPSVRSYWTDPRRNSRACTAPGLTTLFAVAKTTRRALGPQLLLLDLPRPKTFPFLAFTRPADGHPLTYQVPTRVIVQRQTRCCTSARRGGDREIFDPSRRARLSVPGNTFARSPTPQVTGLSFNTPGTHLHPQSRPMTLFTLRRSATGEDQT